MGHEVSPVLPSGIGEGFYDFEVNGAVRVSVDEQAFADLSDLIFNTGIARRYREGLHSDYVRREDVLQMLYDRKRKFLKPTTLGFSDPGKTRGLSLHRL